MICVFDFKESRRVGSAFHHHFTGSVACALTCSVSLIDVCGLNYSTKTLPYCTHTGFHSLQYVLTALYTYKCTSVYTVDITACVLASCKGKNYKSIITIYMYIIYTIYVYYTHTLYNIYAKLSK